MKKQWTKSVAAQWGLFLPPARPSLSELAYIERLLLQSKSKKKNFKVAVMGSTPEYRDLCQTTNTDYKCIDYSEKNFIELRQYQLHKDDNSHLLVSDWREMKFKEKFDLFIGDLFTCVTPIDDHERLYQNIQGHCNPGAKIVIKVPLRENNHCLDHKKIFQHYRKKLSYLNPFSAVWREVLLADYDFMADTMHCQTSSAALKQSYKAGIITAYEYGEFKKRWDVLGNFKMNIPLRKDFLRTLKKYFAIEKVVVGSDWYAQNIPIIVVKKI